MSEASVSNKDQDLFIKNLRQETAESHQKLEENALSRSILKPSVALPDYQAYLVKMYGVTIACENQIFPAITHLLPDLAERYKSDFIIQDLKATGFPDTQTGSLPVFQFNFSSTAEAMGIMYVLEGSTLGGRILYKHIHASLGLTEENGVRYFWGYGPQTGILWKSFISSLTQFAEENEESDQIISSAKKTFTNIDNWLSSSN